MESLIAYLLPRLLPISSHICYSADKQSQHYALRSFPMCIGSCRVATVADWDIPRPAFPPLQPFRWVMRISSQPYSRDIPYLFILVSFVIPWQYLGLICMPAGAQGWRDLSDFEMYLNRRGVGEASRSSGSLIGLWKCYEDNQSQHIKLDRLCMCFRGIAR